ncbi:MAG: extracellular solute-binding protein [Christensenellales bacterium]
MRKLVALMAAAVMLVAFCAGASAATQVTIWHTFTDAQQAALEQFAADFNASQSDYEVVVESQAYSGFLDNVYNAVANGVGPNMIINYASTAADYVKDGLVVDLSKYVFDDEIGMADIYNSLPDSIKAETVGFSDGGMYALPAVTTGPIFFINKTIYDELGLTAPTTWEELAENSKKIYEAKGIAGFAADSLTDMMQALMMQSGAGYIDVENKCVLFDTDEAKAWLKWFGDNVEAGYFALNPTGDYWSNDFNAGLVASYLGSCAGVPYIKPDGFEYTVAPMVRGDKTEWYPAWDRGAIVFNKSEEENKGMYLFVKYFLSPEVNAEWAQAMNALSPYGTTQASEAYSTFTESMDPSLIAVQADLDVAGALPTVTGSYAVRNALKDAAIAVSGGVSAEDAMAECVATSNAALRNNTPNQKPFGAGGHQSVSPFSAFCFEMLCSLPPKGEESITDCLTEFQGIINGERGGKMSQPKLLVFMIDALCESDITHMRTLKHFGWMLENGALVREMLPVYPSFTYPCHVSIMTGCYPDKHGIPHNEQVKAGVHPVPWYTSRKLVKKKFFAEYAKEHGFSTCLVNWPVSAGADVDINLPMCMPMSYRGDDPRQFFEGVSSPEVLDRYFWKYGYMLAAATRCSTAVWMTSPTRLRRISSAITVSRT